MHVGAAIKCIFGRRLNAFWAVDWMQLLWAYDVSGMEPLGKPRRRRQQRGSRGGSKAGRSQRPRADHSLWASPGGDGSREGVEEAEGRQEPETQSGPEPLGKPRKRRRQRGSRGGRKAGSSQTQRQAGAQGGRQEHREAGGEGQTRQSKCGR